MNKPKHGAPERDPSISRTKGEANNTQDCMNNLAKDLAERKAKKAAETAAAEQKKAAEEENQS